MAVMPRSFLQASLVMTGTIIGAGVFGLPVVFARIGFVWGTLLYFGLACVVAAMHLLYVEVQLAVRGHHRLSGAAVRILGPFFGKIAAITYPAHIFGTNLIYLLLASAFLARLADVIHLPLPFGVIQLGYWFIVAVLVYRGFRVLVHLEALITMTLVVLLFLISLFAWRVSFVALPEFLFRWDGGAIPLGVLLFSLTGLPAVGEVVEFVQRDRARAYSAVVTGTLIAALFSWFFGISWALLTAPTAGVGEAVNVPASLQAVTWIIPLIGFCSVFTSHLTTASSLFATFHRDFGWRRHHAWIATVVPPLLLLFLFTQDVLRLVDTVGSVFSAFNATLVCLMALALALRTTQRTNVLIGVSSLLTGMVFVAILLQKLAQFVLPSPL